MPDPKTTPVLRQRFFDAVADGLGPTVTACELGISIDTARQWTKGLRRLSGSVANDVPTQERGKRPAMTGITLVHTADMREAGQGDTITFTAWIMNDSRGPLHKVRIINRSFTNAGMDSLKYSNEPDPSDRLIGSLMPGEAACRSFTYQVTETDSWNGGELVSAVGVQAMACNGDMLWDEGDSTVSIFFGNIHT